MKTDGSDPEHKFHALIPMDPYHMYTLTASLASDASEVDADMVSPASIMMLNQYSNGTVKAFYNDKEFTPIGCTTSSTEDCTLSAFIAAVDTKGAKLDIVLACGV